MEACGIHGVLHGILRASIYTYPFILPKPCLDPDLERGILTFLIAVDDCVILLMVIIKSTSAC
jgi:hypothetical protein